ncbi:hypothetical protein [Borreliella burgdorferi]|uniref:hypothetical protein n=2 Tax=Borreliella burgdorferi TaxID=139 RepID=UPI001E53C172|nr:hypothetical protein [Borreliella burgdorferi]
MSRFNLNFLFLLIILFGCNLHHRRNANKLLVDIEHSVDDFEYANNKKKLEIEERELLERKERELLERRKRDQLVNELRYAEEFEWQVQYYTREYQDEIKRLEKKIEEEILNLNFFVENGYKRVRTMNAYQFHQYEIERLMKEKKESNSSYYIKLKDDSIKYHKTYTDEIRSRIPNVESRLIELKKANIERYKANIERYNNEIKRLHETKGKGLIDKSDVSKFRAEFDKLKYNNMIEENKNSVEIWKEDIENCQYSIISHEVEYNRYNNLKSEVDSLEALNSRLQEIKNSIEEKKLEINMLKNRIEETELRNKELKNQYDSIT